MLVEKEFATNGGRVLVLIVDVLGRDKFEVGMVDVDGNCVRRSELSWEDRRGVDAAAFDTCRKVWLETPEEEFEAASAG